ncbi:uncharacterized protein LOC134237686 [Saccostrea cucullata]|uniref:uncharacterized protein LOC134237686 n=1 Tax=Saccostrea cuccullata TaxID=36930 RepID=UPI002ED3508E
MGDAPENKQHLAESPPEQRLSRLSIPSTSQNKHKPSDEQKLKESKQNKAKKFPTSQGHFSLSTNSPKLSSLKQPLRHFLVSDKPFLPVTPSRFTLNKNCNSNAPLQLNAQKSLQLSDNYKKCNSKAPLKLNAQKFLQLPDNQLKVDQSGMAVLSSKEVEPKHVDSSSTASTETGCTNKVSYTFSSTHGSESAVEGGSLEEQYLLSDNRWKSDLSHVPSSEDIKSEGFDFSLQSFPETDSMHQFSSENSPQPNSNVATKSFHSSFSESPGFLSICSDSTDNSSWQGIEISNDVKVLDISLSDFPDTDSMGKDSIEIFSEHGTEGSDKVRTRNFDLSFIESLESDSRCSDSTKKFSQQGKKGPNSEIIQTKASETLSVKPLKTDLMCENYSQHRTEGANSKPVKTKVYETSINEPPENNSMCNNTTKTPLQHKTESTKEQSTIGESHVSVSFLPIPHSEVKRLPSQHKKGRITEEGKDQLSLRVSRVGEQANPKKRQQPSGQSKDVKERLENLELEESPEKSYGKRQALEQDRTESNKKLRALKCEHCKHLMQSKNMELANNLDISCEICSKEFDCYCALNFHKLTNHTEKRSHCTICCKVIGDSELSEHLQNRAQTSRDLVITCNTCNANRNKWSNRTIFKKKSFCTHLQGKDTLYNNVLIKCPQCSAEFDRLEIFESHKEKMH